MRGLLGDVIRMDNCGGKEVSRTDQTEEFD